MAGDKRKKNGLFGGYKTRQEQLDAQMEGAGLDPKTGAPKPTGKSLRDAQPTRPAKKQPQKQKEKGPKKCPVWIRSADCVSKGYAPR